MTEADKGWRAIFADGRALAVTVLMGGVGLQAIETFVGSTLMPSVVADIGGLEFFSWNTTVFIMASIIASIFAAVRPFGLGPRGCYVLAAAGFALGSLMCGLAPSMPVMLAGRAIQGFGAGLLTAMSYAMIRIVFPQALWGRAFALISSVWGVSTLIGPAIGGVFASYDAWRWAFLILVPLALLLGALAMRVIPARSDERPGTSMPLAQIVLLISAVLAVSLASVLTDGVMLPAVLIALALLAIVGLGAVEARSSVRLFPRGTFSVGGALAPLFAVMLLLNLAIISDMFVPLFLQELHGLSPLAAGYMVALVALGWSGGSILTSGWTGGRERLALGVGPLFQALAALGLTLFVPHAGAVGDLLPLTLIGLALLLLGIGIGAAWPHVSTRLLSTTPEGERDVAAAAISMVQLFASGLGAAIAGVIVNAAGLASEEAAGNAASAAFWLFGLFILVPVLAMPIMASIIRRPQPAALEQPAE